MKKKVSLELCNDHLKSLFQAIERGDVKAVYELEHRLTHEEECVACAYALKAKGQVREVLNVFLQEEGFMVAQPLSLGFIEELRYWGVRFIVLTGLALLFMRIGSYTKSLFFGSTAVIGSFGWIGVIMAVIATYVLIDNWLLEN